MIDTESFKLISQVQTGSEPVRVAIQPDQRYVWVGNNAKGDEGGVTVVDTESLEVAAELKTGFCDLRRAWGQYVRDSGKDVKWFKRDVLHANERGEQSVGRILARFLSPDSPRGGESTK